MKQYLNDKLLELIKRREEAVNNLEYWQDNGGSVNFDGDVRDLNIEIYELKMKILRGGR